MTPRSVHLHTPFQKAQRGEEETCPRLHSHAEVTALVLQPRFPPLLAHHAKDTKREKTPQLMTPLSFPTGPVTLILPENQLPIPGRGRDNARFTEGKLRLREAKRPANVRPVGSSGARTKPRPEHPQTGAPIHRVRVSGQQPTSSERSLRAGGFRLLLSTRRPANCRFPGLGSGTGRPGPTSASPMPPCQFPLRAAHSQHHAEIPAADRPPLTGSGAPGFPSHGPQAHPAHRRAPTHLSGGRTPTHQQLRLRTTAPPGSATQPLRLR